MKNTNKNLNRIKNQKTKNHLLTRAALFALTMIIPSAAFAQSIVLGEPDPPQGTESSVSQENFQKGTMVQDPFFSEIPSLHRRTFNHFDPFEEREFRSRQAMRWKKEIQLRRERRMTERKQRRQRFLLSQQAVESEDFEGDEGEVDDNLNPQPSITVDSENNTQVIIQLGEDNEKELTQSGEDNELELLQDGKNNKGSIDQSGSRNKAAIAQMGNDNSAKIRQNGSNNKATIDLGN